MPVPYRDYYFVIARRDDHYGAERVDGPKLAILGDELFDAALDCLFHKGWRDAACVLVYE